MAKARVKAAATPGVHQESESIRTTGHPCGWIRKRAPATPPFGKGARRSRTPPYFSRQKPDGRRTLGIVYSTKAEISLPQMLLM